MASLQQHFVLVHGAGHGAWCWFKLRHLLQDAGHKVSCFDLTGAGINLTDPNTLVSFHDYNQPLSHFMSCLPPNHKVVLVGHSAGGLSLTQALHEFADKISVAIFLAAAMLPFGFLTEEDMNDVVEDLSGYGDVFQMYHGMGPNNPPTSLKLKEEFQRELFYHMSPTEQVAAPFYSSSSIGLRSRGLLSTSSFRMGSCSSPQFNTSCRLLFRELDLDPLDHTLQAHICKATTSS